MGCGSSQPATKPGEIKQDKKDTSIEKPAGKYILDNPGKLTNCYEVDKTTLGEGSYGKVNKAMHKENKTLRAVKTINRAQLKNTDRFKQEIAIMKMLDHPNIIKLFETFEDAKNIYLVMELCVGGELFDRIISAGHFQERQAAALIQQIVRAIYYLHENHVCHRDLKPENFLFATKDEIDKNLLKIIDFGLSCKFTPGNALKTKAGTPYYVAPQVLAGKYGHESDMWSVGVIMYVLLCGYPPFHGDTDDDVLAKVRMGNFTFAPADWKAVSDDAKDLIRKLLTMSPRDRFSAEQALQHEWIKNKAPAAKNINLQANFVDNLRFFRGQNKLKKAALHIIASQLDDRQIKSLRETFMHLDSNGDGLLTLSEMKAGLQQANLKDIPPDLQDIMASVDSDGSGMIDYTEFLAATLDHKWHNQEDVVWQAFRVFDLNGDGVISQEELKSVLNDGNVKEAFPGLEEIMEQVDANGDGEIDFHEFMTMMKNKQ